MNSASIELTVYGATWCADCRRTKRFLDLHGVRYAWVDIEQDPEAQAYAQQLQGGGHTIPVVVFPDGSFLLEPTDAALAAKLAASTAPS